MQQGVLAGLVRSSLFAPQRTWALLEPPFGKESHSKSHLSPQTDSFISNECSSAVLSGAAYTCECCREPPAARGGLSLPAAAAAAFHFPGGSLCFQCRVPAVCIGSVGPCTPTDSWGSAEELRESGTATLFLLCLGASLADE